MNIPLQIQIPENQTLNQDTVSIDRRVSVGLIGASFGTNNLGVAALTCGTIASICHSFQNASVFLLDYGKEGSVFQVPHSGGIATVELVNIRFSKRFYLRNNIAFLLFLALCLRLVPSRQIRILLLQRNRILKKIWDADIIGSIAGGDSFSDMYGLGRLIYVALPQVLVLMIGKPLVLLPQTFGPFKGNLARAIASYIFGRSSMVYTREPNGLENVRGLTGSNNGNMAFSYDMGFALDPYIRPERIPPWLSEYDRNKPLIGLNTSGLLYIGGYTQKNMFGIKSDYVSLIFKLIDLFVLTHGAHVLLVPHVFGTGENSESDAIACKKIYNNASENVRTQLHFLEGEYDQYEIKSLIGRCDFFVGSRMHACIAAISQCIPAVGLAYSHKFRGVYESVGVEELVIDIREHDENSVLDIVDRAYRRAPEFRTRLETTIPAVRESVLSLFSRINSKHDPSDTRISKDR